MSISRKEIQLLKNKTVDELKKELDYNWEMFYKYQGHPMIQKSHQTYINQINKQLNRIKK